VRRFAKQIVKKILACAFVVKAHVVDAILRARARKTFVAQRRSPTSGVAKSPYFIASFVCSGAARSILRAAFVAHDVVSRIRDVGDVARCVMRRGYTLC
jgi:hypothetical protein